jgi:hypothetical protein
MNEKYLRNSVKLTEADRRRRRINQIDDSLARPVEEGREWEMRRFALERERDILTQAH